MPNEIHQFFEIIRFINHENDDEHVHKFDFQFYNCQMLTKIENFQFLNFVNNNSLKKFRTI